MVEAAPAEKKAWDGQEPKRFALDSRVTGRVVASSVTLALRLGSGALTAGWKGFGLGDASGAEGYTFTTLPGNRILTEQTDVTSFARPAEPIKLYEFEGCPFCKKVREACAYLDISAEFYPCPRGSPNYRPFVEKEGGKAQFPYMIDPNQNVSMYESDDIIKHLFNNYGPGEDAIPGTLSGSPLNAISAGLSLLPRAGAGSTYRSAKTPEEPLVFWGYEASPFCKIVREVLNELEIPHVVKTCARGSPNRDEMVDKFGLFQVPLLEDPNTGKAYFESAQIIEYLESEYALNTLN